MTFVDNYRLSIFKPFTMTIMECDGRGKEDNFKANIDYRSTLFYIIYRFCAP